MTPIAKLLADPGLEVLVHAGRQDFEILHEMTGLVPSHVFDVQVAAAFAGIGASLPYGRVVEWATGIKLPKHESYSDWCRRPLTEGQLRYAADDVKYLPQVGAKLKERLTELGRLGWALDELESMSSPETYAFDPGDAWNRVGGRGALSGAGAAVLREVARWREEAAAKRDLPRGWILKDPSLIEIARRRPSTIKELASIRGVAPKEVERSGDAILEAVQRGVVAPPIETVGGPGRAAVQKARLWSGLAEAVVRSRCDAADIATELVATKPELESFLADLADRQDYDPEELATRHRLLRGWRRELAGDAVLSVAAGKIALKVSKDTPFISEVPVDSEVALDES